MAAILDRIVLRDTQSSVDTRLLRELFHAEKRKKLLEKSLKQYGIEVPKDDIPYSVAKAKVEELTEEVKIVAGKMGMTADMKEMSKLETEYVKLSTELDKYNNAMMMTKEWAAEEKAKEQRWEESVHPENYAALQKMWRHMPVTIRDMSEEQLTAEPTPNGKTLPKAMARKFKRTNILLLLRMNPADVEPMHPSSLEAMRTTGLTLTERRALYEQLKAMGPKWGAQSSDKMAERKWMWHSSLKGKFKETVEKYTKHVEQYGPPGNHPYAKRNDPSGGCPLLGNQCPVKADNVDYSGDYGYPDSPEYTKNEIQKHNLLSVEDIRARKEDG
jgi:hypothetical protein